MSEALKAQKSEPSAAKPGKPITHVLMTVDDSASMHGLAQATISGFNEYIDSLRKDKGSKYRVTTAIFGTEYHLLSNASKLSAMPRLDNRNYHAKQGGTALLDAVGRMIVDFERETELGPEDKVLLVVQTDGQENSSHRFTTEQISKMIEEREGTGRWQAVFLGAGPSAWQQGRSLGFRDHNVIQTANTAAGTRSSYAGMTASTRSYSKGATPEAVAAALRTEVEKGA